jgi:P4 family phage/plasmid primase-like protien
MKNPSYVKPAEDGTASSSQNNNKTVPSAPAQSNPIQDLMGLYGPPAYRNSKGELSRLNEPFWAAYHARQEVEIIFDPHEQEFYSYDELNGLFLKRSSDSIRKKLAAQILEAGRTWQSFAELEKFRNEGHLHGVLKHLRGEVEKPAVFQPNGRIVHLANCMLIFKEDGKFETQSFAPFFQSRNQSPILYNPNAKCPEFERKILSHVAHDDRELLQQYAGQCLLARNLTQRILILDGVGGASKGAFVLSIIGIVGSQNARELRTRFLADRFEIGRCLGKTLLVGSDVRANFLSEEGADRLKSLVGGDLLEAELKTSNAQFRIEGVFNTMITSNSRLRVRLQGDETAWKRRLAIARYEHPFGGDKIPDIHLLLLRTEGSGILNWCLQGARKLLKNIHETGDIALSPSQVDRVKTLLSESDSLRIFLRENLVRVPGSDLTGTEILECYTSYCISAGWIPTPLRLAQQQLDDLMLELFGTAKVNDIKRDGKNQRGFRYVRFRKDDED